MKKLYLILAVAVTGIGVALTYYLFEAAVHSSINFIWNDVFNTDTNRLLVLPLCLALSLVYFGLQHYLDKKSEHTTTHGLAETPNPTIANYLKVLLIGFFSLLAGASLGPEAILVPACMIVGGFIGLKLFKSDKEAVKLLGAAGFIALFAAFFNSFIVGLLSVLIITKQAKVKLSAPLLLMAVVASGASTLTLAVVKGHGLIQFPPMQWTLTLNDFLAVGILFILGAAAIYLLGSLHTGITKLYLPFIEKHAWWVNALIASAGLSAIYLIGGPLIEFTGNESIQPLIDQADILGVTGLLLIILAKILAIAWSKAIGYRGGLIFPSLFIVAALILLIDQYIDTNFVYGMIAALAGMFVADSKVKILL